jgi:hypothetical protein
MLTEDRRVDMRKEFPGDEALQQIHLARKTLKGLQYGALQDTHGWMAPALG